MSESDFCRRRILPSNVFITLLIRNIVMTLRIAPNGSFFDKIDNNAPAIFGFDHTTGARKINVT